MLRGVIKIPAYNRTKQSFSFTIVLVFGSWLSRHFPSSSPFNYLNARYENRPDSQGRNVPTEEKSFCRPRLQLMEWSRECSGTWSQMGRVVIMSQSANLTHPYGRAAQRKAMMQHSHWTTG